MALFRSLFLAASQNAWMRERAPRYRMVRRTVARFMPGEELDDALTAAHRLQRENLGTVFTHLGENVADAREAAAVADHYCEVLERIRADSLATEVSVKLTHLGLDLSTELCGENLERVVAAAGPNSCVWIDMESSPYVDRTLELYRRGRHAGQNVGVCVQAYLFRTMDDVKDLAPLGGAIRLVKGAYKEPADVAFPKKKDVDANYFAVTQALLAPEARRAGLRTAIATHDVLLIRRIIEWAERQGLGKHDYEFQMLYGIQTAEQHRLAQEGFRSLVLVAYGKAWYAWFMRRLAERPANALFALKNILTNASGQ